MQYFNIQVASQLSGVSSATIRAWEKRYNAVIPDRAENKHRLYSETDIEKLAILLKLTELGQSIGRVAHLDLSILKEIYTRLMHRPYEEKDVMTPHHEKIDTEKMLGNILLALSTYKLDILNHELEKAQMNLGPRDLCLKILMPLLTHAKMTIAQKHTLNALIRFVSGQIICQHYQNTFQQNELLLLTTPEGEWHEVGILGMALLCVHYGLKFIYLGASLPAKSLAEVANTLNPKTIVLGIKKEEIIDDYLNILKVHLTCNSNLIIGGNVNSSRHSNLGKKKIQFFPTLNAFDDFLAKS